jgi:uncharacterized protein (DUF952 family)
MDTTDTHIFHLVSREEWDPDLPRYAPDSLEAEGFVHCSTEEQLARVANAVFPDHRDLLVLEIDPTQVTAEVVWEDLYDLDENFPHIYGPVEREAIVSVTTYPPTRSPSH